MAGGTIELGFLFNEIDDNYIDISTESIKNNIEHAFSKVNFVGKDIKDDNHVLITFCIEYENIINTLNCYSQKEYIDEIYRIENSLILFAKDNIKKYSVDYIFIDSNFPDDEKYLLDDIITQDVHPIVCYYTDKFNIRYASYLLDRLSNRKDIKNTILSSQKEENKFNKESYYKIKSGKDIIITNKVDIHYIILFVLTALLTIFLLIEVSYLKNDMNVKSFGLFFGVILLEFVTYILFPYIIQKKLYLKLNDKGIYFRRKKEFKDSKEIFIAWNKIEALIDSGELYTVNDGKINVESIHKSDKFKSLIENTYKNEFDCFGTNLYIIKKEGEKSTPEIYEIGSLLNGCSNSSNCNNIINKLNYIKLIKRMWVEKNNITET